ncbi:MAG: restriction endonuclease subunit S [Veillonellaceae bacterium]|nr:restriction endonuclease subunit S [Veillonellaceae bacterium]
MAKKKEKTLEEKLQEALVPENQWPYMLPENWCWTMLKYISKKISDGSHNPPKNSGSGIPLLSAANVCEFSIDMDSANRWILEEEWVDENKRTCLEKGDVLLTIVATIGRVAIVENEKFALQRSVAVIKPNQVLSKYLMYFLASPYIQAFMHNNAKGTAQKGFYLKSLEQLYIALPSLSEQKRIVHRIESLFAKLDEAKEKIQQVLDGAEMRKAAILHKAFTGELTKTWRKENGISEDSWVEYTLQSVCTMKITDGTHKTPTYSDKDNGVVFLSAKDITSGEINWENTKYITSELHTELYSRLAPQINDILLAKNGTTGVAALVKEDKVFDIYVTLALLRPDLEIVIPEYLLNIINSPICKVQFNENLTGIGVPNLHLRDIKDVKIKVPSISEQEIIADKVEMLLANEGMVTKNCLKQIEVIDTMKKSILAKAFRGELGTNNPTEDSALNLLKEVLQDKS